MTFQEHELLGHKPLLRIVAALGTAVIGAAMFTGATSEARGYGETHCEGIAPHPVTPGESVTDTITSLANKLGISATDYSMIFSKDNPIVFAYDEVADEAVFGKDTTSVKVPSKCY